MAWDDKAFIERVRRRCKELGRSERDVLRSAGLAHDFLHTNPIHGRSTVALDKLAAELDWTLAEIIGGAGPPFP